MSDVKLDYLNPFTTIKRLTRRLSPVTIRNYAMYLEPFFRSRGQNPDQFREWAMKQDPLVVDDLFAEYTEKFKSKSGAANTATVALRSYCSHNAIKLPKSTAKYINQKTYRPYTRTEIDKLLNYLDDPIHKLYVTVAKDTGLRAKHVLKLQYRHIKQDYEAKLSTVAIRFEDQEYHKRKAAGITFFGEETTSLINECIEKQLIKQQDDQNLIDMRYNAIFDVLKVARRKANIDPAIQPSHGLRKFFINTLQESGIIRDDLELITGDYGGSTIKENYLTRHVDKLRPLYEKAYADLKVHTDPEIQKKFQSQEEEITQLKQRIQQLERDDAKIRGDAQNLPEAWAKLSDETWEGYKVYIEIKREQARAKLENPSAPITTATESEIIGAVNHILKERTQAKQQQN